LTPIKPFWRVGRAVAERGTEAMNRRRVDLSASGKNATDIDASIALHTSVNKIVASSDNSPFPMQQTRTCKWPYVIGNSAD
jgi:hypothetical protein